MLRMRQREPAGSADADALVALLPKVRRWLHRLLGPGAALDDVTQDALIEIARALPRFRGEIGRAHV